MSYNICVISAIAAKHIGPGPQQRSGYFLHRYIQLLPPHFFKNWTFSKTGFCTFSKLGSVRGFDIIFSHKIENPKPETCFAKVTLDRIGNQKQSVLWCNPTKYQKSLAFRFLRKGLSNTNFSSNILVLTFQFSHISHDSCMSTHCTPASHNRRSSSLCL